MNAKHLIYIVILVVIGVCIYSFRSGSGGAGKDNAIAGLSEPKQTSLKKSDGTGKQLEIDGYDVTVTYKYKYEVDTVSRMR